MNKKIKYIFLFLLIGQKSIAGFPNPGNPYPPYGEYQNSPASPPYTSEQSKQASIPVQYEKSVNQSQYSQSASNGPENSHDQYPKNPAYAENLYNLGDKSSPYGSGSPSAPAQEMEQRRDSPNSLAPREAAPGPEETAFWKKHPPGGNPPPNIAPGQAPGNSGFAYN